MTDLADIHRTLDSIRQVHQELVFQVYLGGGSLAGLAGSTRQIYETLAGYLAPDLTRLALAAEQISATVTAGIPLELSMPAVDLTGISSGLAEIGVGLRTHIGERLDAMRICVCRLAAQGEIMVKLATGLAGVDPAGWIGESPDIPRQKQNTLTGAFAQAQLDAGEAMFHHASPSWASDRAVEFGAWWAELARQVTGTSDQRAAEYLDPSAIGKDYDKAKAYLMDKAMGWIRSLLWEPKMKGELAVDKAWDRAAAAFGTAAAAGIGAHVLSGVLGMQLLGSGGLRLTGLPAMIGQFAGFGPIVAAVQGNFYRAYLDLPMRYLMMSQFRPTIPDIGTLLELRFKSRSTDKMPQVATKAGFRKILSYYGFSNEWIDAIEDHLYKEPRYFELAVMGECSEAAADLPWWTRKGLRMGYDDKDAGYITGGIRRKVAGGYIQGYMGQVFRQVSLGMMTPEEFAEVAEGAGLAAESLEFATLQAQEQWASEEVANTIFILKQEYSRDQIDADQFRDALDSLGLRSEKIDFILRIETCKRYKRIPLLTHSDVARKVSSAYRVAFRAGLLTAETYRANLIAAGIPDEVADLRMVMDGRARDLAIIRELRSWNLPVLRERVTTGRLTIGQYHQELIALDFPHAYLQLEVALVTALVDRHRQQRVQSRLLPNYERAYIAGLTSAESLKRIFREAGWSSREIRVRMGMLGSLRAEVARRRIEKPTAQPAGPGQPTPNMAGREWAFVAGGLSEEELTALYGQAGYDADWIARRIAALKPLVAEQLAALEGAPGALGASISGPGG